MLLELLVWLVKVCHKVPCACGGEITLGVNYEVWMEILVGKEGCNAGGGTWSIVVSELS